ncbi:hypothetical protein Hanom_Chr12g01173121 [Helianthus anomalus]
MCIAGCTFAFFVLLHCCVVPLLCLLVFWWSLSEEIKDLHLCCCWGPYCIFAQGPQIFEYFRRRPWCCVELRLQLLLVGCPICPSYFLC